MSSREFQYKFRRDRKYQIFQFEIDEDEKDSTENRSTWYDMAPTIWFRFDETKNKYYTKFMPPPYTINRSNKLHTLVKKCSAAEKDWPEYEVIPKGDADSYPKATKCVENLVLGDDIGCTTDTSINERAKLRIRLRKKQENVGTKFSEEKIENELSKIPGLKTAADSDEEDCESSASSKSGIIPEKRDQIKKIFPLRQSFNNLPSTDETDFDLFFGNAQSIDKHQAKNLLKQMDYSKTTINLENDGNTSNHESTTRRDFVSSVSQKISGGIIPEKPGAIKKMFPFKQACNNLPSAYETDFDSLLKNTKSTAKGAKKSVEKKDFSKTCNDLKNDEERCFKAIMSLKINVDGLRQDVREFRREFNSTREERRENPLYAVENFNDKYMILFPLKTLADFEDFDKKLNGNEQMRNDFKREIQFYMVQNKTLTKNLTSILQNLIDRDIAMSFTTTKPVPGKSLFKDTTFCRCIMEIFKSKAANENSEFRTKTFYQNLGTVISNSKDWFGHRVSKKKVNTAPASPKDSANSEIQEQIINHTDKN